MWTAGGSFLSTWGLRGELAQLGPLLLGAPRALVTPGDPDLFPGPSTG